MAQVKERTYFVSGMHCASFDMLIEKELLRMKGVKSVEASTSKGSVVLEYENKEPSLSRLNQIFKNNGYTFSDQPAGVSDNPSKNNFLSIAGISLGIISIFIIINKLGLSSLINVSSKSALPAFFVFGILAGLSSCAALVGGVILSMSKQWMELYSEKASTFEKLKPHFMFNTGRLISYGLFGGLLGAIVSRLAISPTFTSFLVLAVSALMFFLALQMLGVKAFRKFQITMPKFVTKGIADETRFRGRFLPFLMGALTFLLPCGFTITAQSLALLSGSLVQGSLIMFLFALGTTFPLMAIGLSSIKFSTKPEISNKFLKVAGVVVLFFAFFNVNAQLNVLGAPNLSNLLQSSNSSGQSNQQAVDKDLAPIVNGKQVLTMSASARGYSPNYFKVKAGVPVRWEITDTGTSGCTNAIISRNLFDGQIPLTPGQVSVKEFTPTKAGKYKFSCWMGMISGTIEVVDGASGANVGSSNIANAQTNSDIIPSGASGCGCGGGGNGSGFCH